MPLTSIALMSASLTCANDTLDLAAAVVEQALKTQSYDCVRQIIENPDLKFPRGELDDAVRQSLTFRAKGRRSYRDIVDGGNATVVLERSGGRGVALFIEKGFVKAYRQDKAGFKRTNFMKHYFSCAFEKKGDRWLLTADFCGTEGDAY